MLETFSLQGSALQDLMAKIYFHSSDSTKALKTIKIAVKDYYPKVGYFKI
jgi:hypothetical protein